MKRMASRLNALSPYFHKNRIDEKKKGDEKKEGKGFEGDFTMIIF